MEPFGDLTDPSKEFIIAIMEELDQEEYHTKDNFRAVYQLMDHRWALTADGMPLELSVGVDESMLDELEKYEYVLNTPDGIVRAYRILREAHLQYGLLQDRGDARGPGATETQREEPALVTPARQHVDTHGKAVGEMASEATLADQSREPEWDVFISHASEDKDTFVRQLAEALTQQGVRVWYDEFTLKLGDRLRRSVERGLAGSRYGVVVLSPDFFDKEWPQRELDGLAALELDGKNRILPVWHRIGRGEVANFSPMLADILAVSSAEGIHVVVERILQVVSPGEREPEHGDGTDLEGHEMIFIAAGSFIMGDDDGEPNEKPVHSVHVDDFFIARYPTTNAQYAEFVAATGQPVPEHWRTESYRAAIATHPVVHVSWYDAVSYCQWLGEETGWRVRLPTEAEWEKAASWDPELRPKRRYPWGEHFDESRCGTEVSKTRKTTPVGRYSPRGDSPYGVGDLAGNVWEWTSSLYGPYPYGVDDGRENPKRKGARVVRGGMFQSDHWSVRCAYRSWIDAEHQDQTLGFRAAASPG